MPLNISEDNAQIEIGGEFNNIEGNPKNLNIENSDTKKVTTTTTVNKGSTNSHNNISVQQSIGQNFC
jgi:hypothetical protein